MYKIDNIDLEIVNLLMEDGRMHAAEIARRVGNISERAVRYRIERMIDNHVINVSAIVNPRGIGMSVVADVLLEVESDSVLEVAKRVAEFENVSYVACSIGETDLSIQVQARDTEDVYRFVTEVIGKIPGVRKTTTSIVPLIVKEVYQWRIPPSLVGKALERK